MYNVPCKISKYIPTHRLIVFGFSITTAEKIFPLAWEVIESLELFNIYVATLTSDGARQNRRFYTLCQSSSKKGIHVSYKTSNCYRKDEELYFMCDVPHQLKTARNCFSNSFSHSKSRNMQVCLTYWLKVHSTCIIIIIISSA